MLRAMTPAQHGAGPEAGPSPVFEPDLALELALSGLQEGRPGLSLALALPLFLALLAGFSFWRFDRGAGDRSGTGSRQRVDVLLEPAQRGVVPRNLPPSPTPGDPDGTGTVDPVLLKYAALRPDLPQATRFTPDLDAAPPSLLPDRETRAALTPDLPLAPGGNGMARGDGSRAGRAPDPRRLTAAPVALDEVRSIKEVMPRLANMRRGLTGAVRVRVRMDADGVPRSATPLSGPEETWPAIIEAALQWRFHVPERLRAQAPIRMDILFRLHYL